MANMQGMRVHIRAGARLQLGFFPYEEGFIGLGLGIEDPHLEVIAQQRLPSLPADDETGAVISLLQQAGWEVDGSVAVVRRMGHHMGWGTGTMFNLSVAEAVCLVSGLSPPVAEIHRLVRPQERTSVGCTLYESGGLVWSDCHRSRQTAWPITWGILVAYPRAVDPNWQVFGTREHEAVRQLQKAVDLKRARDWKQMMESAWESVLGVNFPQWLQTFHTLQQEISRVYTAIPGVPGLDPRSRKLIKWWHENLGVEGMQSSWGPAVYALGPVDQVSLWRANTQERFGSEMRVMVARPTKQGRLIDWERSERVAYPGSR